MIKSPLEPAVKKRTMKRMLFLLTVFFTCLNVFSQEHMMFNGIPIDGKVEELVHKLELKGYKLDRYLDGDAIMKGTFAGKSATLYVLGTAKTKTAWNVSVDFGESNSWYSLKSEYNDFKELYTKKYGSPKNKICVCQFFAVSLHRLFL